MHKKLIVANWKMLPESLAEAQQILDLTNQYIESLGDRANFNLVLCPPFVFIEEVAKIVKNSSLVHQAVLGAQDISEDDTGADTGQISGPMLRNLGVEYVIVGHSERRWKLSESDEIVNKKIGAVLRNDMTPIVCIGEKTREGDYKEFLKTQVEQTFSGLSADEIEKCIVAYEPVWAISANPNATPDTPASALESILFIQEVLATSYKLQATSFLYGGSVKSHNVSDFIRQDMIHGVLVGGASVDKQEFIKILSSVSKS